MKNPLNLPTTSDNPLPVMILMMCQPWTDRFPNITPNAAKYAINEDGDERLNDVLKILRRYPNDYSYKFFTERESDAETIAVLKTFYGDIAFYQHAVVAWVKSDRLASVLRDALNE